MGNLSESNELRVAGIIKESIADGPGIRYVIFVQGCKHNCEGCHNPQTHSFAGGSLIDTNTIIKEIKRNPLLDGVTFTGGEPFEQAAVLADLGQQIRKMGLNIITYTGYTFEYILEHMKDIEGWGELLNITDILVDGRFEIEKLNLMLKFRGSENQRVLDVKKSLEAASPIEIEF